MATVYANGRSIVHKGDGQTNVAAPPDVCKTPSPAGPIPIPYVNIAMTSNLAKATKKVKIEGNPAGNAGSNLATSTGDEPGSAGGILSSKIKGKLTWATKSATVKLEGKGAVRFMDVAQHNGNSFNTVFMEMGGTGFAYGDDFEGLCPVCNKDAGGEKHAIPELIEGSLKTTLAILADLEACEAAWKEAEAERAAAQVSLERKSKANKNMKDEKIAAERAHIEALQRKRDNLDAHRRANSSKYMVGVMICLTGKKFAAISGGDMPEKFSSIAQSHGCTVISEAATVDDFKALSSAPTAVEGQWNEVLHKNAGSETGYGNKPGTCAGAKLIGKSGHIADSMTEIMFQYSGKKKPTKIFGVIQRGSEGEDGLAVDMKRDAGDTVPSCKSCQDTLFMARCDIEGKTCG